MASDKPDRHTLAKTAGNVRSLDFGERADLWGKWCQGANVFDLAEEFETSPAEIEAAISLTAAELGYPRNHIDPELERFRILEASDRMKAFLIRNLKDSERVLKDLNAARRVVLNDRDLPELKKEERATYRELMDARHAELKSVVGLMTEYRTTNDFIAQLTGIKRSKPTREPKKVVTDEERLEILDDAKLRELAGDENTASS